MMITLVANTPGTPGYPSIVAEDGREILIQTDHDWVGVASSFGFTGNEGDYAEAREWIDDHDGDTVEDPGYFE